jgi:hypothetical protein
LEQKRDQACATLDLIRERLRERIGKCSRSEFLTLNDEFDRANELLGHARAALDNHVRQHCCLAQDGAAASLHNE